MKEVTGLSYFEIWETFSLVTVYASDDDNDYDDAIATHTYTGLEYYLSAFKGVWNQNGDKKQERIY